MVVLTRSQSAPRARVDGNRAANLPDGSRHQITADGTIVQKRPDGSKVTTWSGKDGRPRVVKETLANGTKVTQRRDGTTTTILPDGTKVVRWPDGTARETRPNGTKIETAPDGNFRELHPSGSSVMWLPDGGLVEMLPNGARLAIFANGSRVLARADGSKASLHEDGTLVESFPDGRKATTWKDGLRKETGADGVKVKRQLSSEQTNRRFKSISVEELGRTFKQALTLGAGAEEPRPHPMRMPRHRLAIIQSLLVLEEEVGLTIDSKALLALKTEGAFGPSLPHKSGSPVPGTPVSSAYPASPITTTMRGALKEAKEQQEKLAEVRDSAVPAQAQRQEETEAPPESNLQSMKEEAQVEDAETPQREQEAPQEVQAQEEEETPLAARGRALAVPRIQTQEIVKVEAPADVASPQEPEWLPGLPATDSEIEDWFQSQETPGEETEHKLLCSWAFTPNLWRDSVGDLSPGLNCRLWGLSQEEKKRLRADAAQEKKQMQGLAPSTREVSRAAVVALRRAERFHQAHFVAWWEAMVRAEQEIQCFAMDGWRPRNLGEGLSPLFEEAPSPWPEIPELPGQRRLREAAAAAEEVTILPTMNFAKGSGQRTSQDIFTGCIPSPWPQGKLKTAPQAPPQTSVRLPGESAVITVHLGGAGCGAGLATWSRLRREHGIGQRGKPVPDATDLLRPRDLLGGSSLHFAEESSGCRLPRAIFADCGPGCLDTVRAAGTFSEAGLVELLRDGHSSLWNSDGPACMSTLEAIRREMEQADTLRCLATTHSLQGRIGGSLAAAVATALEQEYPKLTRWNLALAPDSSGKQSAEESYTTLLSLWAIRPASSLISLVDNEALDRLAKSSPFGFGLETAGFNDYNGIIGRVLADFTSPMRVGRLANASDGWSCLLPNQVVNNLVPYPRVNLTFAALAPLSPKAAETSTADFVYDGLTQGALLSGEPLSGRCLGTGLWCRGIAHSQVVDVVSRYRSEISSASFVSGAFVIGSEPNPRGSGASAMALRSSTGLISRVALPWRKSFDKYRTLREGLQAFRGQEADLDAAREDAAVMAADAASLETEDEPAADEE